jgi:hypothetical protein
LRKIVLILVLLALPDEKGRKEVIFQDEKIDESVLEAQNIIFSNIGCVIAL